MSSRYKPSKNTFDENEGLFGKCLLIFYNLTSTFYHITSVNILVCSPMKERGDHEEIPQRRGSMEPIGKYGTVNLCVKANGERTTPQVNGQRVWVGWSLETNL